MPPNVEDAPYLGSLGFKKHASGVDNKKKNGDFWLDGKREDDGAEGYWRIHNGLYDLTNFIKSHPGGEQWLELTKGTDITEAFEVHHIKTIPESLLKKYYVRAAKTPRISPYTFKEEGFYNTLKRNISDELEKMPRKGITTSALYTDLLLLATFVLSILACKFWSYTLIIPAGYVLTSVTIAAHNYFHQKDNLRMYYFNMSLMNFREWRITHSLSHHLFTNTVSDLEILLLQPIVQYFPVEKGSIQKYVSWIYWPMIWPIYFHMALLNRFITAIVYNETRSFTKADLIPYTLPLAMYLLGGQTLLHTLGMWTLIVSVASAYFVFVGISAAHHHPDIFHDGDAPREETDWGLLQLDAVADRSEITGSHYLVLTNFGDHALHHLFPTLDHGLLAQLYPTFKKTLKQFNMEMQLTSQFELIKGQFQQLSRTSPKTTRPARFWPRLKT